MSLIDDYFNENLIWTPAVRNSDGTSKKDGSGRTLYGPEQTICGMLKDQFKMVRDKTGVEIVSSGAARMKEPVLVDDKLNGRVVVASSVLKDFEGSAEGRKVYLK